MATSVTLKPNAIDISGSTSGTTTLQASAVAGTTTLTLPAATDTLVGKATTDTLTNKTLTGAAMNGTLGATTPSTASVTTLTTSSTVTHSGGTANGVAYLDGSKVLTTGSALVFDGTNLGVGVTPSANAGQKTLSIANQTGGFAALTMGSNFTQAGYIGYNMGNTGTNSTWKYISADNGSALWFNGNEFRFMQFASGSAGATTSGTQAMTLDASGGLKVLNTIGVGNTAPSTSGAGITFPTTQSASSDANTLDDYEEGTWIPTFTAATAPTGVGYDAQSGSYTKIGNTVHLRFGLKLNSKGSGGSGVVRIGGLPFLSENINSYIEPNFSVGTGGNTTSSALRFYIPGNSQYCEARIVGNSSGPVNTDTMFNWSDAGNGSWFISCEAMYMVP